MKKLVILLLAAIMAIALGACGGKKDNVIETTEINTTIPETTIEVMTEELTFTDKVIFNVIIDTSEYSDEETSNIIAELRTKASENNMELNLGAARYQEIQFIITCHYNSADETITANNVKKILFEGITVKTIG